MAGEQTHIAGSKQNALTPEQLAQHTAELKKKLVMGRMKSQTPVPLEGHVNGGDPLVGPVNVDPASIDELIRKNSGGMATSTVTDPNSGLLDRVLEQVQTHHTAKRSGATKRPSEPRPKAADTIVVATEPPPTPVISTPQDIVMTDDPINRPQSVPVSSTSDGSLVRLLEQDEDLKDWLALTNYHDVESRNKKLEVYRERHREKIRKVQALEAQMKQMEAERRKLMEEVEPDMGFLWPTATSAAAAPVPSSIASTPKPSENASSIREPTEVKREKFDAMSAKRSLDAAPTEATHRPGKQARVDAQHSHVGKQTPMHRDHEQGGNDDRDSARKDEQPSTSRYIKSEDGRRALMMHESPPRRPRDWSPHGSPPGRRDASDHRGPPRRPDWNEHRGQDNSNYRREPETGRQPQGRNGAPVFFDVGGKGDTRYFIVKSWTDENVYRCMEEGVWVTQQHNEGLLNQAFTQNKNVILFFSANQSKAFQGYARMISPTSPRNPTPRWVAGLRWPCSNPFRVRWLSKIEVEFFRIGHLRNSLNEGLAVLVGKDGQEIEERCGASLLAEMYAIALDKYERRDPSLSFRNQ